jgi:hypothetical protein
MESNVRITKLVRVKELCREDYLDLVEETRLQLGYDHTELCIQNNVPIDAMCNFSHTRQGEDYWEHRAFGKEFKL